MSWGIKVKVFCGAGGWVTTGDTSVVKSTYYYQVRVLGILVWSVTIDNLDYRTAKDMFGNKLVD